MLEGKKRKKSRKSISESLENLDSLDIPGATLIPSKDLSKDSKDIQGQKIIENKLDKDLQIVYNCIVANDIVSISQEDYGWVVKFRDNRKLVVQQLGAKSED